MGRKQRAEWVWRGRLAKFSKSGLTVPDFCRQEGVSMPSFYQWRKRIEHQRAETMSVRRIKSLKQNSSRPQSFVPVSVPVAVSTLAEIEFPNGVRIRVPAMNAEALRLAIRMGNDLCREVE
jgi:hypothetical protein